MDDGKKNGYDESKKQSEGKVVDTVRVVPLDG